MRQLRNAFANQTVPSNRLQKIGIYASIVFAFWSVILTIYYADSMQKVEDLDKVIKELKNQNELQQAQIKSLASIAEKNNDIYNKLIQISTTANEQNENLKNEI